VTAGKILLIAVAGTLGIGVAIFGKQWWNGAGDLEPIFLSQDKAEAPDRLDRLPELRLREIDGGEVSSDLWAGKVVVLNFWATWCPPCLRELPLFDELQRMYSKDHLQIVGIAVDDEPNVEAFLLKHPVGFPILLGDADAIEISQRLGNRLQGLPFTVIFDRRGKRVYARTGEMTRDSLSEYLEPLLSEVIATKKTGNLSGKE
jgi:thiol-disulfide isomerase/thioredoxin